MIDHVQLENYLDWAMIYYPADKYAVHFMGHSDATPFFLPPDQGEPINIPPPGDDEIFMSWGPQMTLWDLRDSIANVPFPEGRGQHAPDDR